MPWDGFVNARDLGGPGSAVFSAVEVMSAPPPEMDRVRVPEAIAEDYAASARELPPLFAAMGVPDQGPPADRALRAHGTTARDAVVDVLEQTDGRFCARAGCPTRTWPRSVPG